MLQGHLNYYAVSGNHPSMWWFCNQVRWLWLKSLRRRSQKAYLSWELRSHRRSLLSANQGATPIASAPLRCQNLEGGAQCIGSARRDLRRERGVILLPFRDHAG